MELRKTGKGFGGVYVLGAGVGACLQRCTVEAEGHGYQLRSRPRGSHTGLLSQPIITHTEWLPLRGLRAVMTTGVSSVPPLDPCCCPLL